MKKKFFALVLTMFFVCGIWCIGAQTGAPVNTSQVSPIYLLQSYKDVSRKIWVIRKMNTKAKSLTDEDKSVITKYIYGAVRGEDTFLLINCYLNETLSSYVPANEITVPLKHRLKYYSDCLSASARKVVLPRNMILYGSWDEKTMRLIFHDKNIANIVNKPVSEENLNKLKEKLLGAKFTEKGFMLTSYDKNKVKKTNFILEICAPKNLQAVLIESFGKKEDKEVLINKYTKWEVKNITKENDKKSEKDFYKITFRYVIK